MRVVRRRRPYKTKALVSQVKDWPYSTFHYYVNQGILPYNWTGIHDVDMTQGFAEV